LTVEPVWLRAADGAAVVLDLAAADGVVVE
jgi:hypothetical protein